MLISKTNNLHHGNSYHTRNQHCTLFLTAVSCPKIPVPQNGYITGCQPPYTVGSVCTQGCNASYVAFGNTIYRNCQSTGMWGGSMLTCQPYGGKDFVIQDKALLLTIHSIRISNIFMSMLRIMGNMLHYSHRFWCLYGLCRISWNDEWGSIRRWLQW